MGCQNNVSNVISITSRIEQKRRQAVTTVQQQKQRQLGDIIVTGTPTRRSDMKFPTLAFVIRSLHARLRSKGLPCPLNYGELLVWISLEILVTEVGIDEIGTWLQHEATLSEIVLSHDADSILSILSGPHGELLARARMIHLGASLEDGGSGVFEI